MLHIVNIFTGLGGLVNHVADVYRRELGPCQIHNVADDSILSAIQQEGGVSAAVEKRVEYLLEIARLIGPDLIVCTCSSVGEVADRVAAHSAIPILRIDAPMVRAALDQSSRIAVMATLQSTMEPTCRLVERMAAETGRYVTLERCLLPEVLPAMLAGNMEAAFEQVRAAARGLQRRCGVLLLAQASLGMFQQRLQPEVDCRVLASTPLCAQYIRETYLDNKGGTADGE